MQEVGHEILATGGADEGRGARHPCLSVHSSLSLRLAYFLIIAVYLYTAEARL